MPRPLRTVCGISIHALREEGDPTRTRNSSWSITNFYPRPPRGGRLAFKGFTKPLCRISIHALREEGDLAAFRLPAQTSYFYPRPPRGGRRTYYWEDDICEIFLSTPSARRATARVRGVPHAGDHFYPRPPRGGRRAHCCTCLLLRYFYPRPPRGGRLQWLLPSRIRANFYPRPPRGGRRYTSASHWRDIDISIHALREEGDESHSSRVSLSLNFYPRPPRGGRPLLSLPSFALMLFLSTPSARRATADGQPRPSP